MPTPDGPVTVKVKPGTEDGTLLRVKGKGAPKLKGSGRGNVLARVKLTVPKKLSKKEREAIEALQKASARRRGAGLVTASADRSLLAGSASTWPRRGIALLSLRPAAAAGWLDPLWLVATLLVVVGLLVMVNVAVARLPGAKLIDERPRYMISVAAELVGMHPQTLRMYEQKGLVRPQRTAGNTRLYSEADLERLRLIQRLTTELGLNLAGVEAVLGLEEQLQRMQARMERLEREMRDAIEQVHKQYRRELVLYDPTRLPRARWTSTS